MAYTCVRVVFEIGHVATIRDIPTHEGFTHDWELFLRGADNTEIHHFVEKVIFHLHETFPNHRRVVKEPPYVVCETGYAGFPLQIDIYLKNKHEPSKIRFNYHLTLQPKGPPLSNVKKEKYVFKNPSEDFRRKLIKGGGVGVGADSASGSHTNHMAALNSDHSADDHKTLSNNKNKASPQDVSVSSKKSKKENTPKNEEQLSANDPFSIFGQPIKTSKIPLVSKSSSKNQISDKQPPPQEKQSHSSKSSKHSSSSHKDKDKDKERGGGGVGGGGSGSGSGSVEKEKTKDKDKNSMKQRSKESGGGGGETSTSSKKDKFKDDKVRILKVSSKDDSKKNSYHEDKPAKEKSSSSSLDKSSSVVIIERTSSSGRGSADKELLKFEKKEKEKKHKEEKKSKSKDKYKQNEKKENIDVVTNKESYVNERSEKLFSNKDDYKEEKKFHRIVNDDKDNKAEKISGKDKSSSGAIAETKNLFNNVNNNSGGNNSGSANNTNADSQIINNGDTQRSRDPEVKHKHHKHKKDKSKKDSKRDKEERSKEKKESKENKERFSAESQQQQQQPQQPPASGPPQTPTATATLHSRSTPKSTTTTDSPRRLKKPIQKLFEADNSDSELSSMDDDPPPPSLQLAHHRLLPPKEIMSSPEMAIIKEEPMPAYNKHEEQTKEEKYDTTTAASTKKKKKTNEERENKKRKRKSKDKEENAANKMIKYENCSHAASAAELAGKQVELSASDRRPPKSVSPSETKFTDEYITKLKELQRKIMTLEDNSGLQRIVQVVAETGQYEITTKTFDFDLCTLDESIVQRLLDFFVP